MHVSSGLNISTLWKNAGKQTQARLWTSSRMIVGICLHVSLCVYACTCVCAIRQIITMPGPLSLAHGRCFWNNISLMLLFTQAAVPVCNTKCVTKQRTEGRGGLITGTWWEEDGRGCVPALFLVYLIFSCIHKASSSLTFLEWLTFLTDF